MSRPRSANGDLERVWERTGWSRKELAQRVNRRGQARGLHLNTDAGTDVGLFYQEADVMRGGGNTRRTLAQYVTGHVLPLVRDADPDTDTGASLFTAASEQTYLLGWMAFDDGLQALAQRYLVQALRLTQASGDAKFGAHVLAGMSDQACMLGHPREALQLATAGRHGLTRAYSPACAVAQSEAAFEKVNRDDKPEWARFIDTAYLAGEWANAFGDIARPVESTRFARRSAAEAHTQKRARRGALSQATLARAALTTGHVDLDVAVHNASGALDLAVTVRSSRCTHAITDLRTRLQPFHTVALARDFDERARLASTECA